MRLLLLAIFISSIVQYSYAQDTKTTKPCESSDKTDLIHYYVIERQARPYQIEHQGRDHSGIITELVYKIFEKTDYQLRTWTYPFKRMIYLMENNRCPLNSLKYNCANWINYGAHSWNTVQSINLSYRAVFTIENVLVSYNYPDFKYNSLYSLQGMTLVLLAGFDYPGLIKFANDGNMTIIYVHSFNAAYGILKRLNGRGLFSDFKLRALYNLKTSGLLNDSHYKIHVAQGILPSYGIHIAMSPTIDKTAQTYINNCLHYLHNVGFVAKVLKKYTE